MNLTPERSYAIVFLIMYDIYVHHSRTINEESIFFFVVS